MGLKGAKDGRLRLIMSDLLYAYVIGRFGRSLNKIKVSAGVFERPQTLRAGRVHGVSWHRGIAD